MPVLTREFKAVGAFGESLRATEHALGWPRFRALDCSCGQILMPHRDKSEKCDHQAVAIADSVSHLDESPWSYRALGHELLAKIDKLHARNHRARRTLRPSRQVQASFDSPEPTPVPFRHHGPRGAIQSIYLAGHRVRRVCLGQVASESPHALEGETFRRRDFQCRWVTYCQEAEEPAAAHPMPVQGGLGQPRAWGVAERIIVLRGALPETPVHCRPVNKRQMQSWSGSGHDIYSCRVLG